MCNKRSSAKIRISSESNPVRIDKCMKHLILFLNENLEDNRMTTVACCCGHGKYPMTIYVRINDSHYREIISGTDLQRFGKRPYFYRMDSEGYYQPRFE